MSKNLFAIIILLVLTVTLAAPAGIIYVDDDAVGANNGSSWDNAFTSLQSALTKPPAAGDEIWVAAGTYKPGTLRTDYFLLPSSVGIYGGFAGTETDLSQRNWRMNETILSGEIGGTDMIDNCYNVVWGGGTNSDTVLDGFTITRGYSNYNEYSGGGGLYNTGGHLRVINCTFVDNGTYYNGGAVWNFFGNPTFINCIFGYNFAWSVGNDAVTSEGRRDIQQGRQPDLDQLLFRLQLSR